MSKISKNQRNKKEIITRTGLDKRNYSCANLSTWVQFWADNPEQALAIAQKELRSPKATPEELKLKYTGE